MNKKFITLCVSALLAGGMVTPAFAQIPSNLNIADEPVRTSLTDWGKTDASSVNDLKEDVYYRITLNTTASNISYGDKALRGTEVKVSYESLSKVSVYDLWKVEKIKSNGSPDGTFKLVNMAGIYLGVDKQGNLVPNGEYQEFVTTNRDGYRTLAVANGVLSSQVITWNSGTPKVNATADAELGFFTPLVDVLDEGELNDKFLSSFTIGVGYYEKDEWKDYAVEHDLQGNVFAGDLKASTEIGTDYIWKQTLTDDEVYLWNGDKIVVLTNSKWSGLNNSLAGTGYKFTLMTPEELAIQESADAAESDASKHVIRSYVFQVTSPNDIADEALEVATKVYDYKNKQYTGWEELYVSEVNDNYYLTTAVAANTEDGTDPNKPVLTLQKADYANSTNQVYVRFTDNNFVDAEHFFSYAL